MPEKYYYYAGEMVECTARANPPARYRWVEMRTGKVQDVNVITLTKDMLGRKFKCVAYNVIQGAEHNKEVIVQFRSTYCLAMINTWPRFRFSFLRKAACICKSWPWTYCHSAVSYCHSAVSVWSAIPVKVGKLL